MGASVQFASTPRPRSQTPLAKLLQKVFGSHNDRVLKGIVPLVEQANRLEPELQRLSDANLRARTGDFRQRLENGEPLDDLLPEAFASVREAAKRTLGQRHYDVQLIGGVVLHRGSIAEMKTGEGKTLVATLPSYLNGLSGRGVHIVTVNDYLAQRDAEWMGEVHRFLGLSVGVIVHDQSEAERREAYASDIAYATNNELGFDYLRDNMKFTSAQLAQRQLHYGLVDEVDSILIDEARTPLIISGPSEQNTQIYAVVNRVIPQLTRGEKGDPKEGVEETGDYWLDEKAGSTTLTEAGIHKVEKMLGVENLYDPEMISALHAVNQALSAHTLKKRDVDYVVNPGETGAKEVQIVDEFTGRLMPGRRWSDGLHQAVEAKEGIQVRAENQTLASVTFQNFFRMYDKLAGMTGTADTEAPEFAKIYDLDVVVVPTHRPMVRADEPDVVFKTEREKFGAVVEDIKERHETGQPVLVGTISIENSEKLAKRLKKQGVPHNVLNAKQHEREAEIVAQAGRHGAVTISTNMAGRGTDIVLGGNPEFLALSKCGHDKQHPEYQARLAEFEAQCAVERDDVVTSGGLHILGTERHESRRIDNQLRGRSGRQGDPGSSQFFLSLEDDLLRIFESDRVKEWWDRVGVEEGEAIENKLLTRVIQNAQTKVEARNFDIRKHLLDYDDVMNKQRQAFYGRRRDAMLREHVHEEIIDMTEGTVVALLDGHWPEKGEPDLDALGELAQVMHGHFGATFDVHRPPFSVDGKLPTDRTAFGRDLYDVLIGVIEDKKKHCDGLAEQHGDIGYPHFENLERDFLLQILDTQWKDHLHSMDGLREGISLRGYGQRDPKLEYQREGYALFDEMQERIDQQVLEVVYKVQLRDPADDPQAPRAGPALGAPAAGPGGGPRRAAPRPGEAPRGKVGKVGRNEPCPCGSGRKYKKCHGTAA
ncbi:MAG: preprotein translocase subunit SecA [bacterium]|jgi:preprotein translocase subunit SecA|nr:preprotein translocase subunit SecA [bacterium]